MFFIPNTVYQLIYSVFFNSFDTSIYVLAIILWILKDSRYDQTQARVQTKTAFHCFSFFAIVLYFTGSK